MATRLPHFGATSLVRHAFGAGTLTLRPGAPPLLRKQVEQNTVRDERTGQALHADGRIGDWIRAYRPDLLA